MLGLHSVTSIGRVVIYQFAGCTLDTARRELRQGDALVAIEPQVFDVLTFLIETRDRVVSRDDLLDTVWHGRIVSEATLSSRLNSARTAIGDNGAEQRLVQTLPRKGVRFVGEVREVADPEPEPLREGAPPAAIAWRDSPRLPTIAVLPFTNMSGDPEQDYFADVMAEEIITALTRSSGLFVIARNSSFAYKGKAIDAALWRNRHQFGDSAPENRTLRSKHRLYEGGPSTLCYIKRNAPVGGGCAIMPHFSLTLPQQQTGRPSTRKWIS